jgi:aromatic ring hydroxylase
VRQLATDKAPGKGTTAASFIPGVGSMYGVPGKTLVGLTTIRIFLPRAHTQAVDTIRMLGSSGLIMTPTEKDFRNPELGEFLSQYLRGANIAAEKRVAIMKLAWDAIGEQSAAAVCFMNGFSRVIRLTIESSITAPTPTRIVLRWRGRFSIR